MTGRPREPQQLLILPPLLAALERAVLFDVRPRVLFAVAHGGRVHNVAERRIVLARVTVEELPERERGGHTHAGHVRGERRGARGRCR